MEREINEEYMQIAQNNLNKDLKKEMIVKFKNIESKQIQEDDDWTDEQDD